MFVCRWSCWLELQLPPPEDHACVAGPQNEAELLQPTTEAQVRNACSLLSDTVLLVFVTWH